MKVNQTFELTKKVKAVRAGSYIVVKVLANTVWFAGNQAGAKHHGMTKTAWESGIKSGVVLA